MHAKRSEVKEAKTELLTNLSKAFLEADKVSGSVSCGKLLAVLAGSINDEEKTVTTMADTMAAMSSNELLQLGMLTNYFSELMEILTASAVEGYITARRKESRTN